MLRKPLICLLNWAFEKLSLVIPLRSPTASVHFLCDLSRAQLADFRNLCSLGPCPHGSLHGYIKIRSDTVVQLLCIVADKKALSATSVDVFWNVYWRPQHLPLFAARWQLARCLLLTAQFFHARLTHRLDDGGSKHLWNKGQLLRDYMV
jgi:hypothetical protein